MVAEASDPRIRLPIFEGPLDLLLFLIRKNEVDVYDIPIESVLKQYLSVIYTMQELQLDVAGEFFVMAATLMEIKSRMLLPKDQQAVAAEGEEEEPMDPRLDLVHQLIQYKRFKDAAADIARLAENQHNAISRENIQGWAAPAEDRPLAGVDRIEVWNVFNNVLRRLSDRLVVGEITDERTTIVDQMELILGRIEREDEFAFSSLFPGPVSLRTLVVTFLAVLELTRLKRLRIRQDASFTEILCLKWTDNAADTPALPT